VGVCAERVAFGTAIAAGHGIGSFKAIAVTTDLGEACSPCGMCRQFIREFCGMDVPIFMFYGSEKYVVKTVGEVCVLILFLVAHHDMLISCSSDSANVIWLRCFGEAASDSKYDRFFVT
jgi:cytidine/deoxycytidylate deaminase-like protein